MSFVRYPVVSPTNEDKIQACNNIAVGDGGTSPWSAVKGNIVQREVESTQLERLYRVEGLS